MAILAAAPTWIAALAIWPLAFPDSPDKARLWPAETVVAVGLALAACCI